MLNFNFIELFSGSLRSFGSSANDSKNSNEGKADLNASSETSLEFCLKISPSSKYSKSLYVKSIMNRHRTIHRNIHYQFNWK